MEKIIYQQVLGFLATPPLWKNDLFGIPQFDFPADLPDKKTAISYSPYSILGKRMESFFEALLKNSKDYKILGSNIQVTREKITIGEIDFLLKSIAENQQYHVELVYKFYVYDPDYNEELERWIGPNRKDSLLQKLRKLKEKQFPLLYKPETKDYLSNLQLNSKDLKQEVCFKANLFLPKHFNYTEKAGSINKECIAGYWIHSEEFCGEEYEGYHFFSPKKQQWPVHPKYAEKWHSYALIKKQVDSFIERKRSPLLWMKKGESEFERFFIVWW
ncbi:DUF1853 family protein [Salegentibacter sp. F188]|uniref:DUF1853 family protein n=1 Tax=Autumnicola patrickiae TaxID=3075591 RepID=A0ABU3E5L3_9FLAO|nr:DUF1853 family protein [Salegentibacter sp. F188]MDT0690492.1 DUF1853 family protein [Salegentibacter sp. F188]